MIETYRPLSKPPQRKLQRCWETESRSWVWHHSTIVCQRLCYKVVNNAFLQCIFEANFDTISDWNRTTGRNARHRLSMYGRHSVRLSCKQAKNSAKSTLTPSLQIKLRCQQSKEGSKASKFEGTQIIAPIFWKSRSTFQEGWRRSQFPNLDPLFRVYYGKQITQMCGCELESSSWLNRCDSYQIFLTTWYCNCHYLRYSCSTKQIEKFVKSKNIKRNHTQGRCDSENK